MELVLLAAATAVGVAAWVINHRRISSLEKSVAEAQARQNIEARLDDLDDQIEQIDDQIHPDRRRRRSRNLLLVPLMAGGAVREHKGAAAMVAALTLGGAGALMADRQSPPEARLVQPATTEPLPPVRPPRPTASTTILHSPPQVPPMAPVVPVAAAAEAYPPGPAAPPRGTPQGDDGVVVDLTVPVLPALPDVELPPVASVTTTTVAVADGPCLVDVDLSLVTAEVCVAGGGHGRTD
jgi:hypothetical protein